MVSIFLEIFDSKFLNAINIRIYMHMHEGNTVFFCDYMTNIKSQRVNKDIKVSRILLYTNI